MLAEGRIWQMERVACKDFLDTVAFYDVDPQDLEAQESGEGPSYQIWNNYAVIDVQGVLMKSVPKIMKLFGFNATGMTDLRQQVLDARRDDAVDGIFLDVDSPGGSVKGLQQAAGELWRARSEAGMHIEAYIDDLAASAGLYLASQANHIVANKGARVGSIGTYMVQYDLSEMAEEEGVDVKLISSGELKGAGEPGTEITEKQMEHWQKIVDKYSGQFIDAVARGRGMEREDVAELATGEVWLAKGAMDVGLIDEISDYPGGEGGMPNAKNVAQAKDDIKAQEGEWSAVPFSRHEDAPLADKDAEWDADREMERAGDEDYGQMVMAERNEGTDRNDVKLPCHRGTGEHALVWNGLTAVAGALNGARGGVDLPEDVQDRIYNGHMTDEYERFDEEPPPRELTEEEYMAYAYAGQLIPPKEDGSMGDSEQDIELSDEQKKIVAEEYLQDNPEVAEDILPDEVKDSLGAEKRDDYRETLNTFLAITGEEPRAVEALKSGKSAETLRQEELERMRSELEDAKQEAQQAKGDLYEGVPEPGGAPQDAEGDVGEEDESGPDTRAEAEERIEEVMEEKDKTKAEAIKWLSKHEPKVIDAYNG